MKQKLYKLIVGYGVWFLHKFFPEYFAAEPLRPTDRYIEYPWVIRNLPPPGTQKVLDVGCSGSMFPLLLKAIGYETYGIDIRDYSPADSFFFTKGDIKVSLYESGYFDVVTAVSSIEHIGLGGRYGEEHDVDGDIKALAEIHRILKVGGLLLMTVPLGNSLRILSNHKIYTLKRLSYLLGNYRWNYQVRQSPEDTYKLALIKAYKDGI